MKKSGIEDAAGIQKELAKSTYKNELIQMGEIYLKSFIELLGFNKSKLNDLLKNKNLHKLMDSIPEEGKHKTNKLIRGNIDKNKIFKLIALNMISLDNILNIISPNNSKGFLSKLMTALITHESNDKPKALDINITIQPDFSSPVITEFEKLRSLFESFSKIKNISINTDKNSLTANLSICKKNENELVCEKIEKALMLKYALDKLFLGNYSIKLSPNS